jgi:hypothetical protein
MKKQNPPKIRFSSSPVLGLLDNNKRKAEEDATFGKTQDGTFFFPPFFCLTNTAQSQIKKRKLTY